VADKPLLRATGTAGELRAGGRLAATFGAWQYRSTRAGWLVTAGLSSQNAHLIDHGAEFQIVLVFEDVVYVGDCHLNRTPGRTDRISAVGGTQLERKDRYGNTRANPSDGQPDPEWLQPVRATRDYLPTWQRARRGVLVRQPGDPQTRPWRR
jgi:hypothetical protein